MTELHELAALRNGFDIDPGVRSRRDDGEVYRVRSPLGHEATLFSRYADVRAVHGDAERLRLDVKGPCADPRSAVPARDLVTIPKGTTLTIDEQPAATFPAEAGFPDRRQVVQRFGDLAPDGTTSTVALSRLFEHPRVRLRFSRFDKLVADGGFGPFHILFVSQRVERRAAFGKTGATVRIGTGIRAIGRTSYTYGQGMFVGGRLVATADATIVLADRSGPLALPDELLADLEELRLPETGAAAAAKPNPRRRERDYYPAAAAVRARVGDIDLNRHVNYIAQLGFYDEAIASHEHDQLGDDAVKKLPQYLPWRYEVNYLGEVLYPGTYDIGIAVSGHDKHTVHYELGLFHSGRCLGTADAAAPRGALSVTAEH